MSAGDRERIDRALFSLAQIRQAARAGDTQRAWRMMEAAGLLESAEAEALSLEGRLLKDRAQRSEGTARAQYFERAEQAYLRAAGDRRATYPLINAATIALLNGKKEQAERLALRTLDLLMSRDHEPETDYWLGATWAEALLLLGDVEQSKARLEAAVAGTPSAWEDHAATIRQLQLVLAHMDLPATLYDHLRPPASVQYSGLIHLPDGEAEAKALIEAAFDEIRPGFVFGALAAGADILIAEAALACGAELHVVLPTSLHQFRALSVEPFGGEWARRFDALIEVAGAVDMMESVDRLSSAAVAMGDEIAMGLAIRRARTLASHAISLRLRRAVDGTTSPEAIWRGRGLPVRELVLDRPVPQDKVRLPAGAMQAVLASIDPFPAEVRHRHGRMPLFSRGVWLLALDDMEAAVDVAVSRLRAVPGTRLGLVFSAADDEEMASGVASVLARGSPPGAISAAGPGIHALDLRAPHYPFEAAGEIVTEYGDIPISCYTLPLAD